MKGHIASKFGKFYIVVDMVDELSGKRRRKWISAANGKGFEKKRDAEKAMPAVLVSMENGTFVDDTKQTFGEMLLKWLEDKRTSVKYSTWKSYDWLVNKHIVPNAGHIALAKLKPQHLHDLYHKLLLPVLAAASIKKAHVIIVDALNRAVTWGMVPRNVAMSVALPRGKKPKFKVWDEKQLQQFLTATEGNKYYAVFELAASTGMRQSELTALPRSLVDLPRLMASVRQAYTLSAKGGHEIEDTKTDSSERSIALFPSTGIMLDRHLQEQQQKRERLEKLGLYKDHGLVFQSEVGTPLDPKKISTAFNAAIKKIQEDDPSFPKIRFHDLRHTHATILLKAGIHPKIVQERLGHSSISVTLDTYSHVLPNLQAAVLQNVGDSITGKENPSLTPPLLPLR